MPLMLHPSGIGGRRPNMGSIRRRVTYHFPVARLERTAPGRARQIGGHDARPGAVGRALAGPPWITMGRSEQQPASVTFHLTPEAVWTGHDGLAEYRPEAFARDGFVHCTDGEALVIEVGNRYYRDDPRAYVVLEIATDALTHPAVYEDEEQRYPHVYGPIDKRAVRRVRRVERGADGIFIGPGAPLDDTAR